MIFSLRRVVLCTAIVAVVGVYAALLPGQRSAMPPVVDVPWIGLPRTGMDASKAELRMLLRVKSWPSLHGGPMSNLSGECGAGQTDIRERYIAHVSKDAWGPFRDIQFDVDGEWLNIAIRDSSLWPPPPPPPPPPESSPANDVIEPLPPTTKIRVKKSQMEPIRRIWASHGLWHAEQKRLGCADGMPVTLEACIDGHYAVRHRNCDMDAYEPSQQLWDAVNRMLPAPEPGYRHER